MSYLFVHYAKKMLIKNSKTLALHRSPPWLVLTESPWLHPCPGTVPVSLSLSGTQEDNNVEYLQNANCVYCIVDNVLNYYVIYFSKTSWSQ